MSARRKQRPVKRSGGGAASGGRRAGSARAEGAKGTRRRSPGTDRTDGTAEGPADGTAIGPPEEGRQAVTRTSAIDDPLRLTRILRATAVGVPTEAVRMPVGTAPGEAPPSAGRGASPGAGVATAVDAPAPTGPAAAAAASAVAPATQPRPVAPSAKPRTRPRPRVGRTPEEAFDRLYAHGTAPLLRQVELLTGDREFAGRAVAYAYDLAWQRWPEVARDSDPVGWVRAAAHSYALAPWHRWVPGHRAPEPATPGSPLEAALLGLDPAHRRAVLLYDGLGLGLPSAAAEVEATIPTTAARITHAREVLTAAVPGLDEDALPEQLAALLDPGPHQDPGPDRDESQEADPEVAEEPQHLRDASERGARRRTAGAYALTGVIAAVTTLSVIFGPIHPGLAHPRRSVPGPAASAPASRSVRTPSAHPLRTPGRPPPPDLEPTPTATSTPTTPTPTTGAASPDGAGSPHAAPSGPARARGGLTHHAVRTRTARRRGSSPAGEGTRAAAR